MLALILLFLTTSMGFAQKIEINTQIGVRQYVYNIIPFTSGLKSIEFNLKVTNGKIVVMALSEDNFELKKSGQNYRYYTFIPDQPVSSLHMTISDLNFDRNFYILISSDNLAESIYVNGYVQVTDSRPATNFALILSICLVLGGIVLVTSIGACLYKCYKKHQLPYVMMPIIVPADIE